jgi:hypothetical protein
MKKNPPRWNAEVGVTSKCKVGRNLNNSRFYLCERGEIRTLNLRLKRSENRFRSTQPRAYRF